MSDLVDSKKMIWCVCTVYSAESSILRLLSCVFVSDFMACFSRSAFLRQSLFWERNFRRSGRVFTALASALHCTKLRYWCFLRGFALAWRISKSGSAFPAVIISVLPFIVFVPGVLLPHGAMLKQRLVLVVSYLRS